MSGGLDILTLNEEDVTKMLAATTHLGSENVNFQVSLIRYLLKHLTSNTYITSMMRQESVPYIFSDKLMTIFSQLKPVTIFVLKLS